MTGAAPPSPTPPAARAGEPVLPYGERALLVDTAASPDPASRARALREPLAALPGVRDAVPGARGVTLLLDVPAQAALPGVEAALRGVGVPAGAPAAGAPRAPRLVEIPVAYGGEDLAEVASLTGLAPGEVVARHAAGTYTVAFLGFAPGFPYLDGLDPALHVPRLPVPRARVPAGAVGLAAGRTCIYPSASPGGWRLIGRTEEVLFDPARRPPSLLAPGDRVRFLPSGGGGSAWR